MFKRYWRDYPLLLQVTLLVLMMFTLVYFVQVVFTYAVPGYNKYNATDLVNATKDSPIELIRAYKWQIFGFSLGLYVLPSLLFTYLLHPRPKEVLGIRKPGKNSQWLLVILVMLGSIPLSSALASFVGSLPLGAGVKEMQAQNERVTQALLVMPGTGDFLFTLFLVGLVPAVGEELLFRGTLLRYASRRRSFFHILPIAGQEVRAGKGIFPFKSIIGPALLISLVFTALHSNVYGFLSIFLDGLLLAMIYYWTGSLLCSMLGHFINNGLQVVLIYVFKGTATAAWLEQDRVEWWVLLIAAVVFGVSLYLLWKNRTPLKEDWNADFKPEEILREE